MKKLSKEKKRAQKLKLAQANKVPTAPIPPVTGAPENKVGRGRGGARTPRVNRVAEATETAEGVSAPEAEVRTESKEDGEVDGEGSTVTQ